MSQTWFTADTHFGHASIVKFCARPFLSEQEREKALVDPRGRWKVSRQTIERHDEALIENINSVVAPEDTLWVLGDFCWGKAKEAAGYLERIRCKHVHLVWGNHDHNSIGTLFESNRQQGIIRVRHQLIWLNHYPMRSWDGRFHGSWHLYGHVHNRFDAIDSQTPYMLTRDVGVDASEYRPISFEELEGYMAPRVEVFNQLRKKIMNGDSDVDGQID